jgi:hypothetical protein
MTDTPSSEDAITMQEAVGKDAGATIYLVR